jgi:type IV pilus assembly protein PilC
MNRRQNTLNFLDMLHMLVKENTGLIDALRVMSAEGIEPGTRGTAENILDSMKRGKSFPDGISLLPADSFILDPLYVSLLRAAEATGTISEILGSITADLKRKDSARRSVLNIMAYPAVIVALACLGTLALIFKGIPLFASAGFLSENALETAKYGMAFAGVFLLASAALMASVFYRVFWRDSPQFKIFYLFSFLLRGNIPLLEALSQCISSFGVSREGRALLAVKNEITRGTQFHKAFGKSGLASPYITGWLSIASENGDLEGACHRIAGYFSARDAQRREMASRFAEPLAIALTGIYLLILIETAILPILTRAGGIL